MSESYESNKKLFWKVRKVRGVKVGVGGKRVKDERVLLEGSRERDGGSTSMSC